jgi:hypothetical protein
MALLIIKCFLRVFIQTSNFLMPYFFEQQRNERKLTFFNDVFFQKNIFSYLEICKDNIWYKWSKTEKIITCL